MSPVSNLSRDLMKTIGFLIIVIGLIATFAGIRRDLDKIWIIWIIFGILAAFTITGIVHYIRSVRNAIRIEFLRDSTEILQKLTSLLVSAKENLYYCGGAGFISEDSGWSEAFTNKLRDPNFTITRLIDMKTTLEYRELLLKGARGDQTMINKVTEEIAEYKKWLRIHQGDLDNLNNSLYNFEGAPLWRYGIHHIIFDNRHVAIIPPPIDRERWVAILDSKEIAKKISSSINCAISKFGLQKITSADLENALRGNISHEN